jgi:hypothetical protein
MKRLRVLASERGLLSFFKLHSDLQNSKSKREALREYTLPDKVVQSSFFYQAAGGIAVGLIV